MNSQYLAKGAELAALPAKRGGSGQAAGSPLTLPPTISLPGVNIMHAGKQVASYSL